MSRRTKAGPGTILRPKTELPVSFPLWPSLFAKRKALRKAIVFFVVAFLISKHIKMRQSKGLPNGIVYF